MGVGEFVGFNVFKTLPQCVLDQAGIDQDDAQKEKNIQMFIRYIVFWSGLLRFCNWMLCYCHITLALKFCTKNYIHIIAKRCFQFQLSGMRSVYFGF